jgi:hypothetical protein
VLGQVKFAAEKDGETLVGNKSKRVIGLEDLSPPLIHDYSISMCNFNNTMLLTPAQDHIVYLTAMLCVQTCCPFVE